jgi:hypothetical protein
LFALTIKYDKNLKNYFIKNSKIIQNSSSRKKNEVLLYLETEQPHFVGKLVLTTVQNMGKDRD